MNIFALLRNWLEKHFAPAPSELFYIGGSDILPPPLVHLVVIRAENIG